MALLCKMGLEDMVMEYEVLLATYNGAKYLSRQLDSIACQSLPPRRILVSDDNSCDQTLNILDNWRKLNDIPVIILPTLDKKLGCCRNFERLLLHCSSDYIMFSDQDDIWHEMKAETFMNKIILGERMYGKNTPLLVHSDLEVVNSSGHQIASSFMRYQTIDPNRNSWLSIAIQNVVTGCATMVNKPCIQLSLPFSSETYLHDWWLALIAARFGKIIYIADSLVRYRQHDLNVIGAMSFYKRLRCRLFHLLNLKGIDAWIGPAIRQIIACTVKFPMDDLCVMSNIHGLVAPSPLRRCISASKLGLSKHGYFRTIVFYFLLLIWKPNSKF